MLIRSLRLKNIKSYGEGSEGAGITVNFQAGVNRVAGRNGHGKTTLIEALGYALFFSEPRNEEHFKTATYFLRSGEKEAEIDVVFEHDGQSFRIERGLGQSKRRSKLVQLSESHAETCGKAVEKSRKQAEEAEKVQRAFEDKQSVYNAAKSALDEAISQSRLAAQGRAHLSEQLAESKDARLKAGQAEPGYLAFGKAEERLKTLRRQQTEKSALEK